MYKYVIKRLLLGILTVFVVFTLNFMLIRMAPGDPIRTMMGKEKNDEVLRQELIKKYGFDKPLHVQYASYLKTVVKGDLGTSIIYNRPVKEMIFEKLGPTFLLVFSAAVIALIVGTSLGILAARREGSFIDVFLSGINYMLNSLPNFWLALMLIILFSSKLGLFPTFGMISPRTKLKGFAYVKDVLWHMFLPLLTLTLVQLPYFFKIAKSSILQVNNEDYILTLRATGMDEKKIFNKYIFRNAILPTITTFGITIAYLITGVALIEIVFAWPGTGRLVLTAINQRDYPTLMGMYLIMSISVAVVMIIVDIVYALFDPRIRY